MFFPTIFKRQIWLKSHFAKKSITLLIKQTTVKIFRHNITCCHVPPTIKPAYCRPSYSKNRKGGTDIFFGTQFTDARQRITAIHIPVRREVNRRSSAVRKVRRHIRRWVAHSHQPVCLQDHQRSQVDHHQLLHLDQTHLHSPNSPLHTDAACRRTILRPPCQFSVTLHGASISRNSPIHAMC